MKIQKSGKREYRYSRTNKEFLIKERCIKNSEILVFDEATSNLDIETENKLIKALKVLEGKTLIFVSHKPSSLELCNKNFTIR